MQAVTTVLELVPLAAIATLGPLGSWAGTAVAAGAVISTFGCLNGWILLQGQIPRAAARDRLFPAAFSGRRLARPVTSTRAAVS